MTIKKIPIADITLDPRLQHRVNLNNETIEAVQGMFEQDGELLWPESLPPLDVVEDGDLKWMWDGHARHAAALRAGMDEVTCKVTQGSFADAEILSLGANGHHGTKRCGEDIQKTLRDAFSIDGMADRSDVEIAKICRVSHTTVGKFRASCNQLQDAPAVRMVTRKGKTFKQNTAKIGKTPSVRKAAAGLPGPTMPSRFAGRNGQSAPAPGGAQAAPAPPKLPLQQQSSLHIKAQSIIHAIEASLEQYQQDCEGSDGVLRKGSEKFAKTLTHAIADLESIANPSAQQNGRLVVSHDHDKPSGAIKCSACDGKGWITKETRDELWDAVVEVTGADSKVNGARIGKLCKLLLSAEPPYNAADIRKLPSIVKQRWPNLNFSFHIGNMERYVGWIRQSHNSSGLLDGIAEFMRRHS